jgi:hypothetical protein
MVERTNKLTVYPAFYYPEFQGDAAIYYFTVSDRDDICKQTESMLENLGLPTHVSVFAIDFNWVIDAIKNGENTSTFIITQDGQQYGVFPS